MDPPCNYIWLLEYLSLALPWAQGIQSFPRANLMGALKAGQTWRPILLSYEGETCQLKGQEPN